MTGRAAPCAAIAPHPADPERIQNREVGQIYRAVCGNQTAQRPTTCAIEDKLAGCDEIEQHTGDRRQQQGPFHLAAECAGDQRQRPRYKVKVRRPLRLPRGLVDGIERGLSTSVPVILHEEIRHRAPVADTIIDGCTPT